MALKRAYTDLDIAASVAADDTIPLVPAAGGTVQRATVQQLVNAVDGLLDAAVVAATAEAEAQADAAAASATTAGTQAGIASTKASEASASAAAALVLASQGLAQTTPAASKVPLADGAGKIDAGWLGGSPSFSGNVITTGQVVRVINSAGGFQIYKDATPTKAWRTTISSVSLDGLGFWHYNGSVWTNYLDIAASGTIFPGADNTQDFGSSSLRWRKGYFGTGLITGSDSGVALQIPVGAALRATGGNGITYFDNSADSASYGGFKFRAGSGYGTLATLDSAGLAVTGAISATGAVSAGSHYAENSGSNYGYYFRNSTAGSAVQLRNAGGGSILIQLGVATPGTATNFSVGWGATSASGGTLETNSTSASLAVNATNVASATTSGLAVTGAISATTYSKCGSYTVATVPSASSSGAGARIYVTDSSGGSNAYFSDGTTWRNGARTALA